jgi:glycosyltransferase involved in cell wall biosynthesis
MNQKKRLLFVIPTLRIGGAEKALVTLFKAMDPSRYDVDLFLFEHGGALQQEVPEWIRILPENKITRAMTLELRYYFGDLLRSGKLLGAVSRLNISIQSSLRYRLHRRQLFSWSRIARHIQPLPEVYDTAVAFLEHFASFYVLDKVAAKRKIGWIHSDYSRSTLLPEEVSAYARFDQLVTISPACKASIEAAIVQTRGRVDVVENLVLPQDVRKRANEPVTISWAPNKKHLVTVGRLEEVKGIDLAVQACKILVDEGLPVCWHVFGEGSKKEMLTKLIRDLSLQDSFYLEGSVINPLPFLNAADVFVQPSRQEGKSIALDEAKILGKPIVVTNYSSVEDQIRNQITGMIVEMQPASIAEGLSALIRDPEKCSLLSRNCLSLPSRHEMIVDKVYRLIDNEEPVIESELP